MTMITLRGAQKIWDDLWPRWLFRLGLLLKIIAVLFLVPGIQQEWFVPFMRHGILFPSLDPWSSFLSAGGDRSAFPYGPVMFLAHLPTVFLGFLADHFVGSGKAVFSQIGFAAGLLLADFALLLLLIQTFADRKAPHEDPLKLNITDKILLFYWLSPLVFFITYWHGQTDIIPTFFLVASLCYLKRQRLVVSAGLLGIAIAAKLSMIIAVPFILLFLFNNRRYHQFLPRYVIVLFVVVALLQGSYLLSPGVQAMMLATPEIGKIYDIAVTLSDGRSIYLVPLFYILLVYIAWRIGRMNFDLLLAYLGLSFFLVLLLTPLFRWLVSLDCTFCGGVSFAGPLYRTLPRLCLCHHVCGL
jgi:Glycosyltransferase family 87